MPVINSMTTTKIIKNNPNRRWKRHKKKKLIKLREDKKGKGMEQKRMRYNLHGRFKLNSLLESLKKYQIFFNL